MVRIFFVLAVIAFAIILLAFYGLFGKFPDEWQWIGIVLAGWALTMSTPSIFQMFWGRACVTTDFEVSAHNNDRSLVVLLSNPPVKSRLLKILGVKRETVQSLTAEIRLLEFGSKKIIAPILQCKIFSDEDDKGKGRIVLPPTFSAAASIMIAMWDDTTHRAVILGDYARSPLLLGKGDYARSPLFLGKGYYIVQVMLIVDGEPKELIRQFIVGEKADELLWAKPQ